MNEELKEKTFTKGVEDGLTETEEREYNPLKSMF
jgi:hypothetical protein